MISRCLGLDVGDATIGVAASDLLGVTAQGVETVRRQNLAADLKRLDELVKEYEAATLVIGLPRNMNGSEGERCRAVREFAAEVEEKIGGVKIVFWDERLSTVEVTNVLKEAGMSWRKRRKVVDKMAAVVILQGYLDSRSV
jgi:putative Holliday junction resolvase